MENIECIHCGKKISSNESLIFCPFCLTQLKCKKCGAQLIKEAQGCSACGYPISTTFSENESLNSIEYEQKGDFRKFRASFSNAVGRDLVTSFSEIIGLPTPSNNRVIGSTSSKFPTTNSVNEDICEIDEISEEEEIVELLKKISKTEGDNVSFQINKFKESGKLNKEIRIALLLLRANEILLKRESIKRSELTEVLKKYKLATSAFRSWIPNCEEIISNNNGTINLTPDGREKANEILKELNDQTIATGAISFSNSSIQKKKTRSKSEDNSTRSKSSASPNESLDKLINDDFFANKRTIGEIVSTLKDSYALPYKSSELSGLLGRLVKNKTLKREKGSNGYEYYI